MYIPRMIKSSILLILISLFVPWVAHTKTPNDPLFTGQWYLKKIHAPEAWNKKVIVAVIDTGIDLVHPDLKKNLWKNKKETPNDGIDNDRNGFIDDYDGWDFIDNDHLPNPEGADTIGYNHGTMVAGLIGAVGNNKRGITGVAWNVSIMPIRAMAIDGGGETSIVAKAVDYAVRMKANIINLSVVGFEDDKKLRAALQRAWKKNVLIVSAAGNEETNLDTKKAYPVCMDSKKNNIIIGVTAVDQKNVRVSTANYGSSCVDLAAPGSDITSTAVGGRTLTWNGSSMAAPLVTGTAALIKSINPRLNNAQIRDILLHSADPIRQNGRIRKELGRGLLNVKRAIFLTF